jgi:hypothetical protein
MSNKCHYVINKNVIWITNDSKFHKKLIWGPKINFYNSRTNFYFYENMDIPIFIIVGQTIGLQILPVFQLLSPTISPTVDNSICVSLNGSWVDFVSASHTVSN